MKPERVTLISLAVEDLSRAKEYYRAMGWQPSFEAEDVAFYDLMCQKLGLYRRDKLEADTRLRVSKNSGAITLAQNFNSPEEVDEWHAKALAAGAIEVTPPTKTHWGGYSGYLHDLDGHLWEFAHNPFWPMDEDGILMQ